MSHNQEITDDDALLVAYAAGELHAEQLQTLTARLSNDAALSANAARLQADYQQLMDAMRQLDVENSSGELGALRQVDHLMQQWHGAPRPMSISAPRWYWRLPAWSYAAAAAVALFVGICFWWAYSSPETGFVVPPVEGPVAQAPDNSSPPAGATPDGQTAEMPLAFQTFSSDDSNQLSDLEQDVVALSSDNFSANGSSSDTNQ